jgi:hypothetical protein
VEITPRTDFAPFTLNSLGGSQMARKDPLKVRRKRRLKKQGRERNVKRPKTHQGKIAKILSLAAVLDIARKQFNTHGYSDKLRNSILGKHQSTLDRLSSQSRAEVHAFFAAFRAASPGQQDRLLQDSRAFVRMDTSGL